MRALLLDTNVLSELARPKPDPHVIEFIRRSPAACVSAITLHELVFGAKRVPDPVKRRKLLAWIEQIENSYADSLIPITPLIARTAAVLRAEEQDQGRILHVEDALIAATTREMGLILATRNTRDFESTGIPLINPWHVAD